MRTSRRIWLPAVLGFGALLSLSSVSVWADPAPPVSFVSSGPPPVRNAQLKLYRVDNVTLDYAGATQNSLEVLGSKVSVTFQNVSFLAALDTLLNASTKTCRIECRQLYAQRLSLKVKDVPLAGLLDSFAKLGGGRLYVLPNKLILAPATALTEDEKKKAKSYGMLLTAATLPDTPEAKALLKPNAQGKTILDVINTPVRSSGDSSLRFLLHGLIDTNAVAWNTFSPILIGDFSKEELNSVVTFQLDGVSYGDALASFARSIGCELYLTPEHFIICALDRLNAPENRQLTQGAIPAFTTSSTNINFSDPSANAS